MKCEVRSAKCGMRSGKWEVGSAKCESTFAKATVDFALRRSEAPTARRSQRAFTMIEIAISLAIIGFALVAIIGVLPRGMNAQKDNREETIIASDTTIFADAIRNGAQGMDYLTNCVVSITNYVTLCDRTGKSKGKFWVNAYTYQGSWMGNSAVNPPLCLTNGYRIVGLLSTPRYLPEGPLPRTTDFYSNYVVATIRALSGPAMDKAPQTNGPVLENAFAYRLYPEITAYSGYDTNVYPISPAITNLQANLHDLRLRLRWPYVPGVGLGQGLQMFRTMVGGELMQTNEPGMAIGPAPFHYALYYFQPRTYVKAP
jgi:prepilin-type N-terminal cleavage/methylation domain-containing protein